MKKILYGTTALVAVGTMAAMPASAQGIKLGLGGYMNNHFGFGDIDSDDALSGEDFNPTNFRSDGEVWFLGEFTADNGITFGANIQLESFTTGDQIDENYGYVEGSFGRILLGSENSAPYLMQYSSPNVGLPVNSGWVTDFIPNPGVNGLFRRPGGSTFVDLGNDENRLTYFTPRFFGFQFGASYTPNIQDNGEGSQQPANEDDEDRNGFHVGANYVNSFGGVDIAIAGGFHTLERGDKVSGNDGEPNSDQQLYSTGANISYRGFTVGGSGAIETGGGASAGRSFDGGFSYSTGPWSIGATYINGRVDGDQTSGRGEQFTAISGGVEYKLAPGVVLEGGVIWADLQGAADRNDDGIVSADEFGGREGVVGAVGLQFRF